jgi:hypothetical protein
MPGLAERLNLFEPLLDELMAVFGLEASFAALVPEDPAFEAYNRCEAKRFKIGEACAIAPESVRENFDLIMHAIAHDHCPSGDRQLIEPLTSALGPRKVMELILGYLEAGSKAEKLGAAMAWYWAVPSLHYPTLEELREAAERDPESGEGSGRVSVGHRRPSSLGNEEIKVLQRELEPRFRIACLRAFVTADDPYDRLYLSYRVPLDPGAYPADLHPVVAVAARIADQHPEQYRHGRGTD